MTDTALYFSPQPTRSARARWAFTEAGLPFEPHAIDIFAGEHRSDAYLGVHPLGLVPSATFDGEVVVESSALALIAASTAPERGLLPQVGSAPWRKALQWTIFAPAELDHALATLNTHRLFLPPPQRDAAVVKDRTEHLCARLALVDRALAGSEYLLAEGFSVADIAIGHSLVWLKMHDLLGLQPRLGAYLDRLATRPAFVEVYGPRVEVFPDPHAAR